MQSVMPVAWQVWALQTVPANQPSKGRKPRTRIARTACITGPVELGHDVVVDDYALLTAAAITGEAQGLVVGDGARIGRFVSIFCTRSVRIESDAVLADMASITDAWGPPLEVGSIPAPRGGAVVIGRGARLGPGSAVCAGVTVGAGALVAPGAVVVGDVPAGAVVGGNPAVVLGRQQ
jgi:acetyltransferase-like isoleucine patch superfamily enzyme